MSDYQFSDPAWKEKIAALPDADWNVNFRLAPAAEASAIRLNRRLVRSGFPNVVFGRGPNDPQPHLTILRIRDKNSPDLDAVLSAVEELPTHAVQAANADFLFHVAEPRLSRARGAYILSDIRPNARARAVLSAFYRQISLDPISELEKLHITYAARHKTPSHKVRLSRSSVAPIARVSSIRVSREGPLGTCLDEITEAVLPKGES